MAAAAKKYGFKDFNHYDDVAATIALIIVGIDPVTKVFTDPQTAMKKDIELIQNDKSISETERKQLLDELNNSPRSPDVKFPEDIELVKKYYDQLETVLQ